MTKILLVEDDKSLREIYGVRLLAEGYDIVSAGDGEEALATAIKEKPDLIVSDVMMPKISGFDMLDILRSTPETKDIKVIMMTALSSEDQRDRGEKLGADRYLVKSQVGIEDVVRTVHEVLGDSPVAAPQFSSIQQQQPKQPQQAPQQQVQQQAPVTQQASEPEVEQLPQPTAPFSSPRPPTLGERVLHPIESNNPQDSQANSISLADRITAELEQADASTPQQQVQQQAQQPQTQPQQFAQPQHAPQPQPQAQPQQQAGQEFQMPQPEQVQVQQQAQQPQAPSESPQPIQIDPNAITSPHTLNVPPRQ